MTSTDTYYEDFIARVNAALASKGKTTRDLAGFLGIALSTAQKRRNGNLSYMYSEVLRIACWLEIDWRVLIAEPVAA